MLDDFVSSDTELWEARPDIASALPPDAEGAPYDARAAAYDRVVGSALYNRLIWGASPARCSTRGPGPPSLPPRLTPRRTDRSSSWTDPSACW